MASAKRNAKIELTSSAAGVDQGLNDARRKLRTFQREQTKSARAAEREAKKADRERVKRERAAEKDRTRAAKSGLSTGKAIAGGLAAAAGFDIAGGLGGMVEDVFDTEKEMTRFAIDAQLGSAAIASFREETAKTSNATGVSRNSLVKASHAYQILTGDAEGAVKAQALFADVANASGASMEDIASTAASLRQNLHFDPSDFRKGFDVLLTLGHKGSIELRDVASQMAGLAPQFKEFGKGDSLDHLTKMGAAMEVIKFNFADAAETATGFRAAMTAISKSKVADKLAAAGVKVWEIDPATGKHIKRDFFAIVADIKKKIPDQKVLADILGGRQESFRALTAMLEHYDEMVGLQQQAANSDQVAKDAHAYMESSSGRIAKAWEQVKNAVAAALTPERIEAFAHVLEKAAGYFGDIVGFADHLAQWIKGPSAEVHQKNAEQDLFLDQANQGDEAGAMKRAKGILAAKSSEDLSFDDKIAAESYGTGAEGFQNLQAAAQRYLKVSGPADIKGAKFANSTWTKGNQEWTGTGWANSDPFGKSLPQGSGLQGPLNPDFAKVMARELVSAMQKAGLGSQPTQVKVGAEPIVKAHANAVSQRTRTGGR